MDPKFKPYRTGMLTVKEKYVCGREDKINKRCHVYYLCRCDCGKEVIFSGDEIARHPYSCGCTPKPAISLIPGPKNRYSLGYTDGTMLCMLKPERAVYSNSSSGVSGVCFENRRKKWRAQIGLKGKNLFLGYFDKKEDAIQARIEAEVKYWNPLLEKRKSIEDNKDKEKPDKEAKVSVIQTSVLNGLNPMKYIEYLMENYGKIKDENTLDAYLPWSGSLPDSVRLTKAEEKEIGEGMKEIEKKNRAE